VARRSVLIVTELRYEVRLQVVIETVYGRTIFDGVWTGIPC